MKTLGIVGGLGPESTIEYYRLLIAGWRERRPDGTHPQLVINSIDVNKVLALAGKGKREDLAEYLLEALAQLDRAGCDFAILAANTPHIVFDEVAARSPLPLINIVQATCDFAKLHGLKKLGLFGTLSTMQGGFYQSVFAKAGVEVIIPDTEQQNCVHEKYVGELVKGIFLPETRQLLQEIAANLKQRNKIDALILGGTELPLLLRDGSELGIPLLDTTRIHVEAAVESLVREGTASTVAFWPNRKVGLGPRGS
jgi:aspartate racemase